MSDEKPLPKSVQYIVKSIPIVLIVSFLVGFYLQERDITDKLQNCSFYTIATPSKMPSEHSLYYTFSYKNKKHKGWTSVGADDLGWSFSRANTMKGRYWVEVSCNDMNVTRMDWDTPVPDTLQHIPLQGWKSILHFDTH